MSIPAFGDPTYAMTRHLPGVDFDAAVERAIDALHKAGFGVLSTINLHVAFHNKLGVDFPRYRILGACNPPLAHQAVVSEPGIGALLPCNVVVAEQEDGSVVSVIDPRALFAVINRPEIMPIAEEVKSKLEHVLEVL